MRPSTLLRLPEMGLSDAVCLDFDLAVRALKRWADHREAETHLEPDHAPERKQRMKTVPTYPTLADVLGLRETKPAISPVDQLKAQDLAAAMAAGNVDWAQYGFAGPA